MRFRAFLERIGPLILSLESVDYFGTSDHFNGQKKKNVNHQNWSGVVNFHCIQVSLVMSMGFIFGCLNRGP